MITTVIVISLILTVFVLVLSLITISQGYGYKHTIDPLEKDKDTQESANQKNN